MVQFSPRDYHPNNMSETMMAATDDSRQSANTRQPMEVPTMTLPTAEVISEDIMVAGFRDCTQEAIDFLINVEKISETDPLILGLKQHLENHRQELEISQAMEDVFQNTEDDIYNNNNNNNNNNNSDFEEITAPTIVNLVVDNDVEIDNDDFDNQSTEELFNSIDFLLLAQNNPRIASLADEILDMMEESSD